MKKILNVRGIVSILMFASLFLEWYQRTYVSQMNAYQSAFRTTKESGLMWIIIILTIVTIFISFVGNDKKTKGIIYGWITAGILIVNIITRFILIPTDFKSTKLGWLLMTILCVVHIVMSIYENKEAVGNIISDKISKV